MKAKAASASRNVSSEPSLAGTAPDRLEPHHEEAERALLGAILIDGDALLLVEDKLTPADFYLHRHGWIYEACQRLHQTGFKIDPLTVANELARQKRLEEAGGQPYLTGLMNAAPSPFNVESYARLVIQAADRRRLIEAAGKLARLAYDETVEDPTGQAEKILQEQLAGRGVETIAGSAQVMDEVLDHLELVRQNRGLVGVPTGLKSLDNKLGGLQKSDLIIIAGRPGMGKTALTTQIVLNAAEAGYRSLIFSLEMSRLQLGQRMVSIKSGVSVHAIRNGAIPADKWAAITGAADAVAALPFAIDDSGDLSPRAIRVRAVKYWVKHGLDLVLIDYLQITGREPDRGSSMHLDMAEASRQFKALAKELNVPVVVLSQLNRGVESRPDKRPHLSDLRESGSIEENADVVLLLYREGYYNPETPFPNVAEINIAKHRSGPGGVVKAYFKLELTRFADLEEAKTEFH